MCAPAAACAVTTNNCSSRLAVDSRLCKGALLCDMHLAKRSSSASLTTACMSSRPSSVVFPPASDASSGLPLLLLSSAQSSRSLLSAATLSGLLLSARDRLLVRVASRNRWSYEAPFRMNTCKGVDWVQWQVHNRPAQSLQHADGIHCHTDHMPPASWDTSAQQIAYAPDRQWHPTQLQ